MSFFRSRMNPDIYHGHNKKPPFFEGWYFKVVDPSEQHRFAIIPGIFKSNDPEHNHCFVQVLDGISGKSIYKPYPVEEFYSSRSEFDIRVGPNHFSANAISLEIEHPELRLSGALLFEDIQPWPVTTFSPGIMGWYSWVPFMETYHGVVSMNHTIRGELLAGSQRINFSGGQGYTEKDWGKSFPAGWTWFQSNHFQQPGTCLTASVAIIPWVGNAFAGFIVGFLHAGQLYRFATYTGAKVEVLNISDQQVVWTICDQSYRLEMTANRAEGGLLQAPTTVSMGRRILETLDASVHVRLTDLRGPTAAVIFEGEGRNAGLEAVGDLALLIKMTMGKRKD